MGEGVDVVEMHYMVEIAYYCWVCLWTSFNQGVLGGKVGTWKRDGGLVSGSIGHQVPHMLRHS